MKVSKVVTRITLACCFALSLSAVAGASSYSFSSNDGSNNTADIMDLEHGYYYGWSISNNLSKQLGSELAKGYEITSATLTYKNIYNWVHETNDQLATFLLSGPPPIPGRETVPLVIDGVTQGHNLYTFTKTISSTKTITSKTVPTTPVGYVLTSATAGGSGKTTYLYTKTTTTVKTSTNTALSGYIRDDAKTIFVPDTVTLSAGIPLSSNLWERADQQSLADVNWGVDNTKIWDGNGINANAWHDPLGGSARGFDLTYAYDQELINVLTEYALDGSFGFGIDPDCHYYNSGVYFTIETAQVPVPEPGTMMLLGAGMFGLAIYGKRRMNKDV